MSILFTKMFLFAKIAADNVDDTLGKVPFDKCVNLVFKLVVIPVS